MLTSLHISNYALIEDLNIDFKSGFSTITGETGAGKSILLGALGMLSGNRADSSVIRSGAKKCVIEGEFAIGQYGLNAFFESVELEYDAHTIIRREVSDTGKSRAFVNDSPVTLNVLNDLGEKLLDVHSQHANLLLADPQFYFGLLDAYGGNSEALNEFQKGFSTLLNTQKELKLLQAKREKELLNLEFNQFQLNELKSAKLVLNEQEDLEQEFELLNNAEDIRIQGDKVSNALIYQTGSVEELLAEAMHALQKLAGFNQSFEPLLSRLQSVEIEAKDIAMELESLTKNLASDPERLQAIDDRLGVLFSLIKKHNVVCVNDLIQKRDALEASVEAVVGGEEIEEALNKTILKLKSELTLKAKLISEKRRKSAKNIEKEVVADLSSMGISYAQLVFDFEEVELSTNGIDQIQLLFSANKGKTLGKLSKTASGGELSRVMLSIKRILSGKKSLPTVIFDEIDTGVSGDVADKMGEIMVKMGKDMQVITITHLPQIAAKGTNHYKVFKSHDQELTTSQLVELSRNERIKEIAQMLSGAKITDAALKNAEELIGN